MKISVAAALFFEMCLISLAANADEIGRYQAVPLPLTSDQSYTQVLIIDTKDGHIWNWIDQPAFGTSRAFQGIIYQGQVKPGTSIGDIIDKRK